MLKEDGLSWVSHFDTRFPPFILHFFFFRFALCIWFGFASEASGKSLIIVQYSYVDEFVYVSINTRSHFILATI